MPAERARQRHHDLRADLRLRLARGPVANASRLRRAHLCQPRARLRPVLDALGHRQPLLRAGAARRARRGLAGRPLLGRTANPPRPGRGGAPRHRPVVREEHRALAQLRGRADALRHPVPGRRCRPHRAAHRRQGAQSRGLRRRRPGARAHRVLRRRLDRRDRQLLGALPAPHLEGRALLLVDDVHAPPLPRNRRLRPQAAAGRARLPRRLQAASTALAENYVGLPLET
jgi:hypothetical protein